MYQFNQMRRLRFLPIGLLVLLSCSKETVKEPVNREMGEVCITLSSTGDGEDASPKTQGIRIYRDNYANSAGKKIPLNSGEYRLLAQHGDSSAVSFNPSAAWYAADEQFTVNPQSTTEVSAVAKMSKVKVAVNHGPNIQADYSQYYSLVKLDGNSSKELRFEKGETRAGYIPAGKLVYELYVYNAATSKWLYCPIDAVEYKPNTFVTFNVDINKGQGTLKVSISIDDSVDEMTQEVEVPFEAAPQEKPTVTLAGFAEGNIFSFVEGVEYENVQANIVAKGKIKSCIFSHTSDYLTNIPSEVDLADPDLDAAVVSALKSAGFKWPRKMRGERFGNVDFAAVPDGKIYSADNGFNGTFKVSVTDSADYTASVDFTIKQVPASLSINVSEGNFWAKRIKGISASTSDGILDYVDIQYSADSQSWTTVKHTSAADGTVLFPDIEGLSPATNYYLRAIYNNNEDNVSEPVSFTTETEQQVGNAGFEEWSDEVFKVGNLWPANWELKWYKPFDCWAVNSKKTMPGYYSNAFLDPNSTNFPCVAYIVNDVYNGEKSAFLYTVRISTTENKLTVPGELFIGTANDSGEHSSEGTLFSSRPSALKFAYKYNPVNNETYYVKVEVKSEDGTLLCSEEKVDGGSSFAWKSETIYLSYNTLKTKAASIYIIFRASSASEPSYNNDVYMNIGNNDVYSSGCNIGSMLYIDDIELIYE